MARPAEPAPGEVAAAYLACERLRWPDARPTCPHCGCPRCYFLAPAEGLGRSTRTGNRSVRRVWKCAACRRQFSVLTGTVLQSTKVALPVWVAVAAKWRTSGDLPTPGELVRRHGMSRDAARRVTRLLGEVCGIGSPGLATLLATSGPSARAMREASAVRRTPRPQRGPSADYA